MSVCLSVVVADLSSSFLPRYKRALAHRVRKEDEDDEAKTVVMELGFSSCFSRLLRLGAVAA